MWARACRRPTAKENGQRVQYVGRIKILFLTQNIIKHVLLEEQQMPLVAMVVVSCVRTTREEKTVEAVRMYVCVAVYVRDCV